MSKATPNDVAARIERAGHPEWVWIRDMYVSPQAQREQNVNRVNKIIAEFDPDQFGVPVLSAREDKFWIIDGAHRIAAAREVLGSDQQVQSWVYRGLSEQQEAEAFLRLNDILTVTTMDRYRIGIEAGRSDECDIDRIVRAAGLRVTRDRGEGTIQAVGTLRRVYNRNGASVLSRTIRIIRDAYGDSGYAAVILDGIAHLCGRYNGDLDDASTVVKLGKLHGGVNGLVNQAEVLHKQTGRPKGQCVAAAAVDVINAGRGRNKLPSWWREI